MSNIKTFEDMEERDAMEIVLSNMTGTGEKLKNYSLISKLFGEVDISKFDLKVLDDVFTSFQNTFIPQKPVMEIFKEMEIGTKRKQPVIFEYKGFEWSGKCIWEKWFNLEDKQVWNTLSLKLPNDGYIYNKAHENLEEGVQALLNKAITYAANFFGDDPISLRVFYLTQKSRLNIKVKCEKRKTWLQITYEYGYPREKISKWYSKDDILNLLKKE